VYNQWIADNRERAKGWGSMPYFVKDNPQYVQGFEVNTYTKAERKFTLARRTDEAMEQSLGRYLQAKYPDIPNTEVAAIYHYTKGNGAAYRQLNNQLRRGNLSEFNEAFSSLLSDGLSKLPAYEGTVYRSVRFNKTQLRAWVDMAQKQSETTFAGFTSTSIDRSIVERFAANHTGRKNNETDVLFVIQGKSGRLIEDISQFGGRLNSTTNQREVLFNKGMRCKIERMVNENGTIIFYLKEI